MTRLPDLKPHISEISSIHRRDGTVELLLKWVLPGSSCFARMLTFQFLFPSTIPYYYSLDTGGPSISYFLLSLILHQDRVHLSGCVSGWKSSSGLPAVPRTSNVKKHPNTEGVMQLCRHADHFKPVHDQRTVATISGTLVLVRRWLRGTESEPRRAQDFSTCPLSSFLSSLDQVFMW